MLLSLFGCRIRQADLTVLSNHNVHLDRLDLDQLRGVQVQGKDAGLYVLGIPIFPAQLEDAVDDALKVGAGDLMTDVVVHWSFIWFLIGRVEFLEVEGKVVKTRGSRQGKQE